MSDQLLIGLPEIANFLRCSVRKLHDPALKKEMVSKGLIFRRKSSTQGQLVWAAYSNDVVKFKKERAAIGKPF
ncbi:MAG: hypothetical protein AB1896_08055 [Thermodesulfobacteriota bacterium]